MNNNYYNEQWYTDRWKSVPLDLKARAIAALSAAISDKDAELIKEKHAKYGHDWIHYLYDLEDEEKEFGWTTSAHHGWGTAVRNLLRDPEFGAGISDDQLPPAPYEDGQTHSNWDDYYVAAVEATIGLR